MKPTLTMTYDAGAAITKRRIVKLSADFTAIQAAAATDAMFGVAAELDAVSGGRVDVHLSGVAEIEAGGTVTRGALLTSDANGKAVAAAPATGVNNRVIGTALVSAADGDVFPVLLGPHQIQGA